MTTILIISIIFISGCIKTEQGKEIIVQAVKEKYGPVTNYACEGFVKCIGSECEELSEWIKVNWTIKKPDAIRIDKEIPLNASYPVTIIAKGNEVYEISRSYSILTGEIKYAHITVWPNEETLTQLLSTNGVVDLINRIFSSPEILSAMDIRTGRFEYQPYVKSTNAIIIEYSKNTDSQIVLDADSLLPLKTPFGIFTNCRLNEPLPDGRFELPADAAVGSIYNYAKRCDNNQGCDDGNNKTVETCKTQGYFWPYCVYEYK